MSSSVTFKPFKNTSLLSQKKYEIITNLQYVLCIGTFIVPGVSLNVPNTYISPGNAAIHTEIVYGSLPTSVLKGQFLKKFSTWL